jgi:hypothetical protein
MANKQVGANSLRPASAHEGRLLSVWIPLCLALAVHVTDQAAHGFFSGHEGRLLSAWIALCLALAVHIADEAANGFLSVYNPTVTAMRARVRWLPFPVFRFNVWLGGLIAANVLLLSLSFFISRPGAWMRPIAYAFAFIMLANGMGHILGTIFGRTVASVRVPRPMPGFYSSPLLLAASVYLLLELYRAT